ncbi:hypothetical protein EVAR_69236_1 [Eumeta japonica]|uniref:Uncharacterized protein n=1 Tax=Eumeta variegata TaxID=151549 RepID=A0A4C2A7R6_EUMVA|nr:hypothetical protein EVAR_69236_1 [Eumeta japonica]
MITKAFHFAPFDSDTRLSMDDGEGAALSENRLSPAGSRDNKCQGSTLEIHHDIRMLDVWTETCASQSALNVHQKKPFSSVFSTYGGERETSARGQRYCDLTSRPVYYGCFIAVLGVLYRGDA